MDIAEIGFAADTSGLDDAAASLQKLVPAARAAETSANNTAASLQRIAPAARAAETGANNVAVSISKVSATAQGMTLATTNVIRVLNTASSGMSTQAANVNKVAAAYQNLNNVQAQINKSTGANKDQFSNIGRASDIEAYGKSLDATRAKYNPLFAAGQQYKTALGDIKNAQKVGAISEKEAGEALLNTKIAFIQQVEAIKGTNAQYVAFNSAAKAAKGSANDLGHAHAGLSTQAMAAQHSIRSMVEGIASGMPPSMVLTQQLNHLSYAASGPGGIKQSFSEAIGMFTKLIPLWAVGAVAIVAVVAAFGMIANSVMKSELALDDLSKMTNVSIANLHGLQQAMSFKGISSDEFSAGMGAFANGVGEAQHNMGSLNGLMIANNMQAKDFQGYLMNVADLVAKTSDGVQKQNILQAAGLPTTQTWVRFMSQGSDAIKKATASSVEFNDAAERNLIQKARDFDDAWNKATTNLQNYLKSIVIDNLDWWTKVSQVLTLAIQLRSLGSGLSAGVLPTQEKGSLDPTSKQFIGPQQLGSSDPKSKEFIGPMQSAADGRMAANSNQPQTQAQLLAANGQSQQRISILGDLASVEQQVAQKQLELNAANLNGVGVSSKLQQQILLGVQAQAEQNDVNKLAAMGIFNLADAQKAASDTLQHWIDQGYVDQNNVQQMAAAHHVLQQQIKASSDAAEAAIGAPMQGLKQFASEATNFGKQLDSSVVGALNGMMTPISQLLSGTTSLNAGFKSLGLVVVQAVQQMIIKLLILGPIAKGLQSMFGGWTSLFSTGGGVPGAIGPTSVGGAPLSMNALGGVYNSPNLSAFSGQIVSQPTLFKFASGAGLMGEAGDEAIMPLKRGPSGSLGVQMYGQQASNDNSTTHVNYSPSYALGGNVSQDDLAQLKRAQEDDRRQFSANVVGTIRDMRKRNVRV